MSSQAEGVKFSSKTPKLSETNVGSGHGKMLEQTFCTTKKNLPEQDPGQSASLCLLTGFHIDTYFPICSRSQMRQQASQVAI